jgi:type I restriction enzyme S subunit
LEKIEIRIPQNINDQSKIATVLSTCDKEIEILNKKLDALKQQKKGLMQKLPTGKVLVKIDQEHDIERGA